MKQRIWSVYFLVLCLQWALIAGTVSNFSGCATRPIHPGTANKLDSGVYDALLTTHSVIESTKGELASGTFPPEVQPRVKSALNILITAYNDADVLYCNPPTGASPTDSCAPTSYHSIAMAGQSTPTVIQHLPDGADCATTDGWKLEGATRVDLCGGARPGPGDSIDVQAEGTPKNGCQ